MTTVRPAGLQDVAVLTRLREEWAAEQRGGPADDPGFADVFAAWFEREAEHRLGLAGGGRRRAGRDAQHAGLHPDAQARPAYL